MWSRNVAIKYNRWLNIYRTCHGVVNVVLQWTVSLFLNINMNRSIFHPFEIERSAIKLQLIFRE